MKLIYLLLTISYLIIPEIALAEEFDPRRGEDGALTDPVEAYGLLGNLFSTLFTLLLFAGALTSFAFLVIGAIQWGTASSGDGAEKGRKTITYAIGGLIMMAAVYIFMLLYNSIIPSA